MADLKMADQVNFLVCHFQVCYFPAFIFLVCQFQVDAIVLLLCTVIILFPALTTHTLILL